MAGLLLTTEVMIAEAPKDQSDHMHPAPGGMDDMGGMGMIRGASLCCRALRGACRSTFVEKKAPEGDSRGYFFGWPALPCILEP